MSLRSLYGMPGLKRHSENLDETNRINKPNMQRVLVESVREKKEPMNQRNVRIVSANYNFNKDKALKLYYQQQEEARAVEAYYAREKSILRQSYVSKQRQKICQESLPKP